MKFVDRFNEIAALEREYQRDGASMVILYGRRRVGKTELIRHFMSGELATLLSGRYVELRMLPLSFREYATVLPGNMSLQAKYNSYVTDGSFPYIIRLDGRKMIIIRSIS